MLLITVLFNALHNWRVYLSSISDYAGVHVVLPRCAVLGDKSRFASCQIACLAWASDVFRPDTAAAVPHADINWPFVLRLCAVSCDTSTCFHLDCISDDAYITQSLLLYSRWSHIAFLKQYVCEALFRCLFRVASLCAVRVLQCR